MPVSEAEADAALRPLGLAGAVALGVVLVTDATATSTLDLTPLGDYLFASDGDVAEPKADHVMSPAGSSRLLATLTPRRRVETALDLGSGCGYQAVLAAEHARHVVATDLNPRAVAYTAFNATLNGFSTIECVVGDWLSALEADRTFELVACNPPYVIAPTRSVLYREDPLVAGGTSRHLARAVPDLLAPHGLAVLLVGWTHAADQHWAEPLTAWLDARCDAWLLRHSSSDPPAYAATWNAHLATDRQRYVDALAGWTEFFVKHNVERLAEGVVAFRRRNTPGRSHVRYADLPPGELDASAADDLLTRLELSSRLEEMDDVEFARQRLDVAPHQRLEQTLRHAGGRFHLAHAALAGESGLQSQFTCSALMLRLLGAIDGQRSVDEVVAMGAPAGMRDQALGLLREAVAFAALQLS
jgi:SAM-dependent methyltransferase